MVLTGVAASAVDAANPGPLHAQLAALLRERIADASLPPGSPLPTEAELQEKFGISRSVVRQALLTLAAEGLVLRGRGRGSVVAARTEHHRSVQRLPGLSAQIAGQGAPAETRVLSITAERNERAEAELGGSRVVEFRRLRSSGGEPIALIHTWLPSHLGASLTSTDLTDASLHAVLRSKQGVTVSSGRRQVRAVAASTEVADALSVNVGTPVLLLEGISLDENGVAVEVFSTWHRADRVVFDINVDADGVAGVGSGPAPGLPSVDPAVAAHPGVGAGAGARAPASEDPSTVELAARARDLAEQLRAVSEQLNTRLG